MSTIKQTSTEKRLWAAIDTERTNSEGGRSKNLQALRAKALAYYNMDKRGDEVEDRSQIVSGDLNASVTATLALMRGMLIDDAAVTIEAFSTEDEAQAKAEADIVSDVIYKEQDGALMVMSAIQDGLLSKQSVLALDVIEVEGQNEIMVRSVPSENVSYQAGFEGALQDIRFWQETVPYTRSDLIDMGHSASIVNELGTLETSLNQVANERDVKGTTIQSASTSEMDIIDCAWVYLRIDLDGDGIAERYRVLTADETVLEHEEFDLVPYAIGSPFITPHRLTGESLADKLFQVQDQSTALKRQLQDNVSIINNGRYAYDPGRVDEADVNTPTAGGGIRARDPQNSIVPIMVPDVTGGILAALATVKKDRAEIAGSALEMASAEAQLMNKSATQASIDKSNSELVSTLIAHNLAQTLIAQVFKLTHEYLRRFSSHNYIARVSGRAVEVDPLTWPDRRRFIVKAGKSPGEKAQQAMALGQHLQASIALMGQGFTGVLADAQTLYRTSQDMLRLNGIQDAETYAIDPTSMQAMQAAQGMQQQQAQQQAMQAQMQQMVADMEKLKIQEDARQADQDNQFNYYKVDTEAELKAAQITADGSIELEKQARDQIAKGGDGNTEGLVQ